MVEKKVEIKGSGESTIELDLMKMYGFSIDKMTPDITLSTYSNLAFIQITGRDVYIDFLQIPGIKRDDKFCVNGVRIYMTFSSAQKLSEVLNKLLRDTYNKGRMEQYPVEEEKEEPHIS